MMLSYENNFKSKREDGRFTSHLAAHMEMHPIIPSARSLLLHF